MRDQTPPRVFFSLHAIHSTSSAWKEKWKMLPNSPKVCSIIVKMQHCDDVSTGDEPAGGDLKPTQTCFLNPNKYRSCICCTFSVLEVFGGAGVRFCAWPHGGNLRCSARSTRYLMKNPGLVLIIRHAAPAARLTPPPSPRHAHSHRARKFLPHPPRSEMNFFRSAPPSN